MNFAADILIVHNYILLYYNIHIYSGNWMHMLHMRGRRRSYKITVSSIMFHNDDDRDTCLIQKFGSESRPDNRGDGTLVSFERIHLRLWTD